MIHKGVTAMTNRMFGNSQILAWLQYYSDNTQIDLERVKILDITRKNKNLIPTVESNDAVLVFTEAGHAHLLPHVERRSGRVRCLVQHRLRAVRPDRAQQAQEHDRPRHQRLCGHARAQSERALDL